MELTPWISKIVRVKGTTIDQLDTNDYAALLKFLKKHGFKKDIDINGCYEEFSHLKFGLEPRQTIFHIDIKNQITSIFINDFLPVF